MKKYKFVYGCVMLFFFLGVLPFSVFGQKIKVACIGNSITEGMGASSGSTTYPSILQKNLGTTNYEVKNFGASGRTLMKNGKEFDGSASSYWTHERYQNALKYNPDIVVIKLGTNDVKKINWDNIKAQYTEDYIELVNSFKALPSNPKIYICYPVPLFGPGNWINEDKVITGEMMPMIDQVAKTTGATIIDCHKPFEGKGYLTGDKVHPNDKGYILLADIITHGIAPDADIPALPDDLFLQVAGYDMSDSKVGTDSSASGLDLSLLWDNNAKTTIETPFSTTNECWFSVDLPRTTGVRAYAITSGKDASKAPKLWRLQGRMKGSTSWNTLDRQVNIEFQANETKVFSEKLKVVSYDCFRLLVEEVNGGEAVSIAEVQLFGCDTPLRSSLMDTKYGGTISSQFNTLPHEGYGNLSDGKTDTKFCTKVSEGNSIWMRYDLPNAVRIGSYALISANDSPERDPSEWTLTGSVDGVRWDLLDKRKNQSFLGRYTMLEYTVNSDKAYKSFKLNVTGKTDLFQLAEWQLFEASKDVGIKGELSSEVILRTVGPRLFIESRADAAGSYELISVSGQCVSKKKLEAGTTQSEYLSPGVYILSLNVAGKKENRKLIIEN